MNHKWTTQRQPTQKEDVSVGIGNAWMERVTASEISWWSDHLDYLNVLFFNLLFGTLWANQKRGGCGPLLWLANCILSDRSKRKLQIWGETLRETKSCKKKNWIVRSKWAGLILALLWHHNVTETMTGLVSKYRPSSFLNRLRLQYFRSINSEPKPDL